jgi:hypothetical protein
MYVPAIYVGNTLMIASATIPAPGLIVGPVHAWVLVLTLLTLCCAILWAVTRPARSEQATAARRRARRRAANRRPSIPLTPGGRRERPPISVVSGASTGSSAPFNTAASISGIGGITV